MSEQERTLAWIEYAEGYWWHPEQFLGPIRLSEHVEYILNVLDQAIEDGHQARVLAEIQRVRDKYITMKHFDAGVAQAKCARAALVNGKIELAFELLYESRENLSRGDSHHYAVVSFMFGLINWLQGPRKYNKAIDAWQEALDVFTRIAHKAGYRSEKHLWYLRQIALMKEFLNFVIQQSDLPELDAVIDDLPDPEPVFAEDLAGKEDREEEAFTGNRKPGGASGGQQKEPAEPKEEQTPPRKPPPPGEQLDHFIQLFVLYDAIPAGLPGPLAFTPTPRFPAGHTGLPADDHLEVTRLRLGEQEYRVQSLIGGQRQVNLINDQQFYVMKVAGHSMNKAGIENGDLVVLRAQMAAENRDIVAAEIIGVDVSRATLKRYSIRAKTVTLAAESSDPAFEGLEWDFKPNSENTQDGFYIRGVAVAVLKPV
jgi:hypothetical protein